MYQATRIWSRCWQCIYISHFHSLFGSFTAVVIVVVVQVSIFLLEWPFLKLSKIAFRALAVTVWPNLLSCLAGYKTTWWPYFISKRQIWLWGSTRKRVTFAYFSFFSFCVYLWVRLKHYLVPLRISSFVLPAFGTAIERDTDFVQSSVRHNPKSYGWLRVEICKFLLRWIIQVAIPNLAVCFKLGVQSMLPSYPMWSTSIQRWDTVAM